MEELNSISAALNTEYTQLLASVKCAKAAQSSMQAIGSIIEDTAEISAEAMKLYKAERA